MTRMKSFFQRPKDYTRNLKEVINSGRHTEPLDSLPDRFASIIQRYEAISDAEPAFRRDVYNILAGACSVAEAMVDTTFPVEEAGAEVAEMMQILARALVYLQSRPTAIGYALLLPEQRRLQGHHATFEEASNARARLIELGISQNCIVVPTRVISQHAVQPRRHRLAQSKDPAPNFIPASITPPPRPVDVPPVELLPEQTDSVQQEPLPMAGPPPTISAAEATSRVNSLEEQLRDLQGPKK